MAGGSEEQGTIIACAVADPSAAQQRGLERGGADTIEPRTEAITCAVNAVFALGTPASR